MLWLALATLAVVVEWSSYDGGGVALAAADAAVGLAFFAGAMLVWRRGPPDLIALQFLATGLAWFAGTVSPSFLYLHRAPLVLLILAYPRGQLRSRLDRLLVSLALVDGLVVSIAQVDVVTLALVGIVIATAALGALRSGADERSARALATGCAVLIGAGLALGSVVRLAGAGAIADMTLLVAYEATLVVSGLALAIGIAIKRSRPAAVADLVVELGASGASGTLRDALAQAYGDPSLELGYRAGDSYVDPEGKLMTLPSSGGRRVLRLVEGGGEPIAALVHDAAVARDPRLDEAVAAALRLAASNAQLQADLRSQVGELATSRRRMIEAGDAQRRRLERRLRQAAELHLEEMRLALDSAHHPAPPRVTLAVEAAQRELEQAIGDVHDLARGIHPRTLTEHGLEPALAELAATAPTPVSVGAPCERFPPAVEAAAYFVCAEALANVTKYAHAAHASVEIQRSNGRLRVVITDDGVGGADPGRGSGLRGLADRVEAAGGRLTVASPTSGGTAVVAEIPLERLA